MIKYCLALMCTILLFSACGKQSEKEAESIQEYIEENSLDAEEAEDGLYYVVTKEGTGANPTINDEVTVHYEGFLLDGTKFDSSKDRGQPSTFPLSGVIRGWQIGIPLFKEGGAGTLIIPSDLAYGSNPPAGSGIPSNAVLVFDVELIEIN